MMRVGASRRASENVDRIISKNHNPGHRMSMPPIQYFTATLFPDAALLQELGEWVRGSDFSAVTAPSRVTLSVEDLLAAVAIQTWKNLGADTGRIDVSWEWPTGRAADAPLIDVKANFPGMTVTDDVRVRIRTAFDDARTLLSDVFAELRASAVKADDSQESPTDSHEVAIGPSVPPTTQEAPP